MVIELWALRDGFLMARDLNIENLEFRVDVTIVIYVMFNVNTSNYILSLLIDGCRMHLHTTSSEFLKHVF